MPELPEVETVRRQLAEVLPGSTVVDAWADPAPKFVSAALARGRVGEVSRHGKFLQIVFQPDDDMLVVHLGMTGRLAFDPAAGSPRHLRAWWSFDDGSRLHYWDPRRFGRTVFVPAGQTLPGMSRLGPDPFNGPFDRELFAERLERCGAPLKTVLLDQVLMAGPGSYVVDEALWRTGLHPTARHVPAAAGLRLADALVAVMEESLEHGGTSMRDYRSLEGAGTNQQRLQCYGRAGQSCARCAAVLLRTVVGGRSATYCPSCQPAPEQSR